MILGVVVSDQPNQTPDQDHQSTQPKKDASVTPHDNQSSQTHSAETDIFRSGQNPSSIPPK
jgi:hypothetical protein